MATRDELYAKFGITAEAAQLFETQLGTLLLAAQGVKNGWHIAADRKRARAVLRDINRSTLGGLLAALKKYVQLSDNLIDQFASALKARNRLNHGFFEHHNFRIQSDEGRDAMYADLETLHDELFAAWQVASAMSELTMQAISDVRASSAGEHPEWLF